MLCYVAIPGRTNIKICKETNIKIKTAAQKIKVVQPELGSSFGKLELY
jgi:hypothetical protein